MIYFFIFTICEPVVLKLRFSFSHSRAQITVSQPSCISKKRKKLCQQVCFVILIIRLKMNLADIVSVVSERYDNGLNS